MYSWLRTLLFRFDAERSHDVALSILRQYPSSPLALFWKQKRIQKPVNVMGIEFPNAVGLAAGLDKNGECIRAFDDMGFGFIEIGTITPKPQPGNPKPRMFRLPEKQAIINRMGFNNKGVEHLVSQVRLARAKGFSGILGINIGKNKDTAEIEAVNDYLLCMEAVYQHADYITINISSPNTPGLRDMQHGSALATLLAQLKSAQKRLSDSTGRYVPLAVKIAPDLTDDAVIEMAKAIEAAGIDAIIATNTTVSRNAVKGLPNANEAGGLSGAILHQQSTHVVKVLADHLQNRLPIIAVGGIDSAAAASAKIDAGASLVQVYTGFIYHGPKLVSDIAQSL